ncbi:MAG: hypothetical protein PHO27_11985 [Sulfuricurvum sp.]|jgi:hypothetical protein|nr:hypothetical protein [Sulfuricurvum sp.]
MNWGEFKEKVELEGVTDDLEIEYIDVDSGMFSEQESICVEVGKDSFFVTEA